MFTWIIRPGRDEAAEGNRIIIIIRSSSSSSRRGRRAENFRGARHCFPKNMYEKLTNCPNFTWFLSEIIKLPEFLWYLPEKLTKFLNFTWFFPMIFAPKCRILHKNCPENFVPEFFFFLGGGEGMCLRLCVWHYHARSWPVTSWWQNWQFCRKL